MKEIELNEVQKSLDKYNSNYYQFKNGLQVFVYLMVKLMLMSLFLGFGLILTANPSTHMLAGILLFCATCVYLTVYFWDFDNPTIMQFLQKGK